MSPKFSFALAAAVVASAAFVPASSADVIYRHTFGNSTGGNIATSNYRWDSYRSSNNVGGVENTTNVAGAIGASNNASKNFLFAQADRITADSGTQNAYNAGNGIVFMSKNANSTTNGQWVAHTNATDFAAINAAYQTAFSTLDPLTVGTVNFVSFDYGIGNNAAHDTSVRLFIQTSTGTYASKDSFTNVINGGGAFSTAAQTATLNFSGLEWYALTGYTAGTSLGTLGNTPIVLGDSETISSLGVYASFTNTGVTARFDNFTIDASAPVVEPPVVPEPASLSLLALGSFALLTRKRSPR